MSFRPARRVQEWNVQWPNLNSVRAPHAATNPIAMTKAKLMSRCEVVLLLQPWSTAIIQTKNSVMAIPAKILRMISAPVTKTKAF